MAICSITSGVTSSHTTTNSSPPNRATVSPARIGCTDAFRGNSQQIVAGAMAEGVVDHLELVDVQEHHAEAAAAPRRARQALPEAIVEEDTVRQPGEGVVERLMRQRELDLLPIGDVLQLRREVLGHSGFVPNE